MTYTVCPNCQNKLKCGQFAKSTKKNDNGDKIINHHYNYECEKCNSKMKIDKEILLTNKETKINKKQKSKDKSKDKKSLSQ